jgi:hypothetical protein
MNKNKNLTFINFSLNQQNQKGLIFNQNLTIQNI